MDSDNIVDVLVDEEIWNPELVSVDGAVMQWSDGSGVALCLFRIGFDEDLFPRLTDETAVCEYYRDSFGAQGMGIVECRLVVVQGHASVRVIGKRVDPAMGASYTGSLTMPLSSKSFVLSLFAQEVGVTGLRDSVVADQALKDCEGALNHF